MVIHMKIHMVIEISLHMSIGTSLHISIDMCRKNVYIHVYEHNYALRIHASIQITDLQQHVYAHVSIYVHTNVHAHDMYLYT